MDDFLFFNTLTIKQINDLLAAGKGAADKFFKSRISDNQRWAGSIKTMADKSLAENAKFGKILEATEKAMYAENNRNKEIDYAAFNRWFSNITGANSGTTTVKKSSDVEKGITGKVYGAYGGGAYNIKNDSVPKVLTNGTVINQSSKSHLQGAAPDSTNSRVIK